MSPKQHFSWMEHHSPQRLGSNSAATPKHKRWKTWYNFSAKEDVKMTGRISKAPIYFESTGLISWGKSVEWSSLGRMSVQMSKVKLNFITYTSLMSSFAQVQQWRSSLVAFDNHGNNGGLCNSLTNAAINASRWCFSNNHVFPFSHYFSPPVLEKKTPSF